MITRKQGHIIPERRTRMTMKCQSSVSKAMTKSSKSSARTADMRTEFSNCALVRPVRGQGSHGSPLLMSCQAKPLLHDDQGQDAGEAGRDAAGRREERHGKSNLKPEVKHVTKEVRSATGPPAKGEYRAKEPTHAEYERHQRCHIPFRAWCQSCVAGRGRNNHHLHGTLKDDGHGDPNATPMFAMDYGFLKKR